MSAHGALSVRLHGGSGWISPHHARQLKARGFRLQWLFSTGNDQAYGLGQATYTTSEIGLDIKIDVEELHNAQKVLQRPDY